MLVATLVYILPLLFTSIFVAFNVVLGDSLSIVPTLTPASLIYEASLNNSDCVTKFVLCGSSKILAVPSV